MNWMSSAAQIEQARLDELNRKAEARAQARRCREAEQRAAAAEQRAKKARADADRQGCDAGAGNGRDGLHDPRGVRDARLGVDRGPVCWGAAALLVRGIPREG